MEMPQGIIYDRACVQQLSGRVRPPPPLRQRQQQQQQQQQIVRSTKRPRTEQSLLIFVRYFRH